MATIIDMPKLSDTMTVGTLVKWLKKEGEKVKRGDMLAEVETDKATMELENFDDGVLLKHYIKEGSTVKIGEAIAAIGKEGEKAPEPTSAPKELKKEDKKEKKEEKEYREDKTPSPAQVSYHPAKVHEQTLQSFASRTPSERIKASPLAKKMASDSGLKLETIAGSGPAGRIVKKDILKAMEGEPISFTSLTSSSTGGPIAEDKSIPLSNIRRVTAEHLMASKTQIPHFYLDIEVDAAPMMKLRAILNKDLEKVNNGNGKLTVNDFILKATVEALRAVPAVNTSWNGDSIRQHAHVDIAFGVAIPDGLLTPVIRNAESKGLRQISAEAKELVAKARNKKLRPEEMTHSTFTVTNLGMYGISDFYGIINPPNAGILSVGATVKKPVVDEYNNIVVGERMKIGFSGDHRVIDGALGAQFLQAFKTILENPALILV